MRKRPKYQLGDKVWSLTIREETILQEACSECGHSEGKTVNAWHVIGPWTICRIDSTFDFEFLYAPDWSSICGWEENTFLTKREATAEQKQRNH